LRPLTDTLPKPLLQIGGKPILEHNLEQLPDEIDEVVLVIGWLGDKIRDYFGDQFLGRRIYYVEQKEKLGTGHALSLCRDILRGKFLVMMGDNLYNRRDMEKCLRHDLCLSVKGAENPQDYAMVEIDAAGALKAVCEKPHNSQSNLVNIALYVLDKRFFDYPLVQIPSGEYGLPQTIVKMADDHSVMIEPAERWTEINTIEDLERDINISL
jgi:bifunctional UDP-N-acetylglucosamine pyrophosphorylase/glucosamine-1-phosphate N-acetyltransferase